MRPDKKYPWGPKDELGGLITKVPYPQPDPALADRIIADLEPKRPGWARRFIIWLQAPRTFSLSPAYAMLALLVFCLPIVMMGYQWHTRPAASGAAFQEASGIPVAFQFSNASARSVAVMGSFNNWDPKGYEMRRQSDSGKWVIELRLTPGRHDYVFLINGEKVFPDPGADLIQEDDYGNRNSVKFIKEGYGQQI